MPEHFVPVFYDQDYYYSPGSLKDPWGSLTPIWKPPLISWVMTAKAVLWRDSEESFQSVFIRLMYISLTPLTFSCLMTLAFTQAPHRHFTLRRQYKQQPWLTAHLSLLHNSSYLGTVISVIITQPLFIIRDEALGTAEGLTTTEQWQGLPLLWWKHTRWEPPAATGKTERMDKLRSRKLFGKSFRDDCWRMKAVRDCWWRSVYDVFKHVRQLF